LCVDPLYPEFAAQYFKLVRHSIETVGGQRSPPCPTQKLDCSERVDGRRTVSFDRLRYVIMREQEGIATDWRRDKREIDYSLYRVAPCGPRFSST
jgi:hypothetical protein